MKIRLLPQNDLILKSIFGLANIPEDISQKKLIPLIYCYNKNISEGIKEKFFTEYQKTIFKNIMIQNEGKKIIKKFYENNIEFIVLKGFFLANSVYENIGIRPMDDIDFLIKKEYEDIVDNVLHSCGYRKYPTYNTTKQTYINDSLRFYLDIHKEIITFKCLNKIVRWDEKDIWRTSYQFKIDNIPVKTLSPTNNIIYLSYHFAFQHGGKNILSLIDICKVMKYYKDEINWNNIMILSKKLNLCKCICFTFSLLSEYFDNIVPKDIVGNLHCFSKFEERIINKILNEGNVASPYLLPLVLIDNNTLRMKYLFNYLVENYKNARIYKKFLLASKAKYS